MKKIDKRKISLVEDIESTQESDKPPLLIIHGASSTKIGFGGEKFPRFVYPDQSTDLSTRIRHFPIKGSEPLNEELLQAYWQSSFKKLNLKPENSKVLISLPTAKLTECPFRDMVQDYFFNQLAVKELSFVSDPFLAMIGFLPKLKKLNAIIVDIGFSQIRIVPILEAAILEDHVAQISFGGFDLTLQLGTWLKNLGYEGPIDALFIRDIKENYCFVRPYNEIIKEQEENIIRYCFDKYEFRLGAERWKLPELFFYKQYFSPKVVSCPRSDYEGNKYDLEENTLSKAISFVIMSLNRAYWEELANNICLVGGGVRFEGLKERITTELMEHLPECKNDIRLLTMQNSDLISFNGASKLSTLKTFQSYWRTKEDYDSGEYDLFL